MGGWLAIAVQLRARALGLPPPGAAMLISPVSDLEVNGESYDTNRESDPTAGPSRKLLCPGPGSAACAAAMSSRSCWRRHAGR